MAFKLNAQQVLMRLEAETPVTIIEALPEMYFKKEHLPNAINLAHDASDALIRDSLPDPNAEIIVYCASGPCQNSDILSDRLLKLGYLNTVDFHEGKEGWREAGFNFER